jgi:hypothetical protein
LKFVFAAKDVADAKLVIELRKESERVVEDRRRDLTNKLHSFQAHGDHITLQQLTFFF